MHILVATIFKILNHFIHVTMIVVGCLHTFMDSGGPPAYMYGGPDCCHGGPPILENII
jgi:hypothetical protein